MTDKIQEEKKEKMKWILVRDEEVRAVFENRKQAVKYLKECLKQTLKDFDKQDNSLANVYDYPFTIPKTEIKPVKYRDTFLGL